MVERSWIFYHFCLLKTGLPHSAETLDFSLSFFLQTFWVDPCAKSAIILIFFLQNTAYRIKVCKSGSSDACFSFCQICVRNIFWEENLSNIEDMGCLIPKNVSTFLSKLMIFSFLEQEYGPRNLVYKQEKKSFLQIPTLLSQNFISQSRPSSHTRMFSRHTQGNLLTGWICVKGKA